MNTATETMNFTRSALVAILIVTMMSSMITTESILESDGQLEAEENYEGNARDSLSAEGVTAKSTILLNKLRRGDWCARVGDVCIADTKLKFAECCKGLRCSCGTLWQSRRCQCKMASILGR